MSKRLASMLDTTKGSIIFSSFRKDCTVCVDISDEIEISDLLLQFIGRYDDRGRSVEDIQIHINELDITQDIKGILTKELNGVNSARFEEEYRIGLEKHYVNYPTINETPESMREKGNELLSQPLGNQFLVKIGDSSNGWEGNLDIVNFIYQHINIPPLSLKNVLDMFNHRNTTNHTLLSLKPIKIVFSSSILGNINSRARGILEFSVQVQGKNPLEDRVIKLENRVEILEQKVLKIENDIVDIKTSISKIEDKIIKIKERISALETWKTEADKKISALEIWKIDVDKKISTLETWKIDVDKKISALETWKSARETLIAVKNQACTETISIDGEKGDIIIL